MVMALWILVASTGEVYRSTTSEGIVHAIESFPGFNEQFTDN